MADPDEAEPGDPDGRLDRAGLEGVGAVGEARAGRAEEDEVRDAPHAAAGRRRHWWRPPAIAGRAERAEQGGGEAAWLILGTLYRWMRTLWCARVGPAVRIDSESVYTV
jgi:hypothetical protein